MQTTLNLKEKDIKKLGYFSTELKLNSKEIVRLIVTKIIKHKPLLEDFSNGLVYQEDDPTYKKFHIDFSQIEYEQNFDLKKIYKFSLSFIVALGILLYADELLESDGEEDMEDSYHNNEYIYVSLSNERGRILLISCKKTKKEG